MSIIKKKSTFYFIILFSLVLNFHHLTPTLFAYEKQPHPAESGDFFPMLNVKNNKLPPCENKTQIKMCRDIHESNFSSGITCAALPEELIPGQDSTGHVGIKSHLSSFYNNLDFQKKIIEGSSLAVSIPKIYIPGHYLHQNKLNLILIDGHHRLATLNYYNIISHHKICSIVKIKKANNIEDKLNNMIKIKYNSKSHEKIDKNSQEYEKNFWNILNNNGLSYVKNIGAYDKANTSFTALPDNAFRGLLSLYTNANNPYKLILKKINPEVPYQEFIIAEKLKLMILFYLKEQTRADDLNILDHFAFYENQKALESCNTNYKIIQTSLHNWSNPELFTQESILLNCYLSNLYENNMALKKSVDYLLLLKKEELIQQ